MGSRTSFTTDAALIARLGEELVAKQETALIELVKNAFDADATCVEVRFEGERPYDAIEIVDNGTGMTPEELSQGFLRLASNLKVRAPKSRKYKRRRAGRKGIGRFAAQRLGRCLELTTKAKGEEGISLIVNWDDFRAGADLGSVTVTLGESHRKRVGTTLRIEGLRDDWTDAQIRRCWRGVLALQQPFPVAPIKDAPKADPGFEVRFLRTNGDENHIVADIKSEILSHLHAVIEMKVDADGAAYWRITKNSFGENVPWTRYHHRAKDAAKPPAYLHLRSVWMKAYYFVLEPGLFSPMVYTKVRDVLSQEGGIRLYRNGFRVVPYGDPHDDWLQLDEAYSKRTMLAPFANRNFFGVIEVQEESGHAFEEHTSREGLIETPAFLELREAASSALITAATRLAEQRGKKTRAGRPKVIPVGEGIEELNVALKALTKALRAKDKKEASRLRDVARTKIGVAQKAVSKQLKEIQSAQRSLADEAAMLRLLATMGMVTAEFNHETGMTFGAFRSDLHATLDFAESAVSTRELRGNVDRARTMLERLDTLTSYLNSLASARASRDMSPQSLSLVVEEFVAGISLQAKSQSVVISQSTPAYDPLFTRPMHKAELASVLLNFYTNAFKAMVRAGGERKIRVKAERDDKFVRVLFCDTGDGIKEADRDRIFDAFYTSSVAAPGGADEVQHAVGTGLGLWIVGQVAQSVGGRVEVVPPPKGYSTCIEFAVPAEDAELQ